MIPSPDWPDDPRADRNLQALAARAAPGMVEEALLAARAEAKAILQRQLVRHLLRESGALSSPEAAGAPGAPGPPAPWQAPDPLPPLPDRRREAPLCARADRGRHDARRGSCYLYGITDAEPSGVHGLAGVDGSTTQAVVDGDLVAVVSPVDAGRAAWTAITDEEPDLDALAPLLRTHERVLEDMLDVGAVLPVRFGVTFADARDVSGLLRTNQPALRAALEGVRGKAEWGLSVSWDAHLVKPDPDDTTGVREASAGRRYLDRRQADRRNAERLDSYRAHLAAALHERLAEISSAAVAHRPNGRRTGGRDARQPLLKGSYLVAHTEAEQFRAEIEQQLHAGRQWALAGELTGPWPPYHFVDLDLAELRP